MSSKKSKIIKTSVSLIIFLTVIGGIITCVFNNSKQKNIDKILGSKDYAYLPIEAKQYLKGVYKETGEIILTEKNKKENVPYLNPQYVEYLTLSEEEKMKVSLIPDVYVLDFSYDETYASQNLPSKYDLRDVEGKSFITPLKDQGNTGLCWAFSAIEQAESYLMVKNGEPYNASTQKFSVRQLDYATSTDGISNYINEYGRRTLGSGGNFLFSSEIMSYGLSLVDESSMPFNESMDTKQLLDVLNYNKSNYELDSTVEIPRIALTLAIDPNYNCDEAYDLDACYDSYFQELKDRYIKEIKNNIIQYGGGVVSTLSPDSKCSFKNNDGYYVTESNDVCYSSLDVHAMQVIGWDDNYEYSYCENNKTNIDSIDGKCTAGSLIKGKGAFIIRNSWGNSDYEYVYLTYDSFHDGAKAPEVSFITSLTPISDRSWDNSYKDSIDSSKIVARQQTSQTFTKKISGAEKIEKIKFNTIVQNGKFSISINADGNTYDISKIVSTNYPGIYTVDLSEENIVIDDSKFNITITGDSSYLIDKSISVFTSNVDSVPVIKTEDMTVDSPNFTVYSKTKNIDSNEKVSYALFDGETELVDYLKVSNNEVAVNNINANLEIVKKISSGDYKLKIGYGNYVYESNLTLISDKKLGGLGTVEDPYLINNGSELELISNDLSAHYKLVNDITLLKSWTPIGTEQNPFVGGFDGDGHTINGLKVSDENNTYSGLFGYVQNSESGDTYIKNLTINGAEIGSNNESGILVGHLEIKKSFPITIDSIYIIGGIVSGTNSGTLIGSIDNNANENELNFTVINNIFSSASINNSNHSGLIGSNSCLQCNISFSNIQNIGITSSNNDGEIYSDPSVSFISQSYTNSYNINNFIMTGFVKKSGRVFNHVIVGSDINGTNGYYLKEKNNVWNHENDSNNINAIDSIVELKNKDNYQSWNNFDKYWEIKNIDGISRIPVLKGVEFDYTTVSKIEMHIDQTISLLDYIKPYTDAIRIKYQTIDNEDKIDIYSEYQDGVSYPTDIKIKGLKSGTTTLHIISDYDGYEGDIEINVIGSDNPEVHFHSNNGEDKEVVQITDLHKKFRLEANSFNKIGYVFGEWNTESDGTGVGYKDLEEMDGLLDNIHLYAKWIPIEYKIIFNSNSGVGNMVNQTFTYDIAQQLNTNIFTKKGYRFVGWNTEKDGTGTIYQNEQSVKNLITENNAIINLYAIWEKQLYSVTFDANEGSFKDNKTTIFEEKWEDDKLDIIEKPIREGYEFKGFFTEKVGGISLENYITESGINQDGLVFYAQWSKEKYKLKFDANSGTGKMDDQIFAYDNAQNIAKNLYTKTGYKFKEWNTKANGTGNSYSDEEIIKLTDNITLYAIWEETYDYIIHEYSVDQINNYISKIMVDTTVNDFKQNIELNAGYNIDVDYKTINNMNVLFTGGKTKIYKDQVLYAEFINIVIGDINGDGAINSADLLRVRQHLLGTKVLNGAYFLSSDINYDDTINSADLLRIRQHLLGTKPIE